MSNNFFLAQISNNQRLFREKWEKFIMQRTNSVKLDFFSENVTTGKERFKKNIEFKIKDKRGRIAIIKK